MMSSSAEGSPARIDSAEAFRLKAKSFGRILFLSGLLAAIALASLPLAVAYLARRDAAYTDVLFPLLLIVGVSSLVLVIAVLVGLFHRMDLVDKRYALGLPNGSVSAIIALMLILVFAMMSVLMHLNSEADFREIKDLTVAQVNQIPGDEILSKNCGGGTCQVERRVERSAAQVDIGKQLVTTVSTLVVAISAFYFGSAQTASAARRLTPRSGESEGEDL